MIGKYIRLQWGGIVLWDSLAPISHAQMAELLAKIPGDAPISAGMVQTVDGMLTCHGESTSLGLRSLPEDTEVLRCQLGFDRGVAVAHAAAAKGSGA